MNDVGESWSDAWTFMLRFYALPGVASACLRLRQTYGLDIPFFLALLHARATGRALDRDGVGRLDREAAKWRDEVIRPLRAVRTAIKSHPWIACDANVPELRTSVKSQELRAEQVEVEMLARLLADLPLAAPPCNSADLCEVARLVLDRQSPTPPEALPADATLIAEAAAAFLAA